MRRYNSIHKMALNALQEGPKDLDGLAKHLHISYAQAALSVRTLRRMGCVVKEEEGFALTPKGALLAKAVWKMKRRKK